MFRTIFMAALCLCLAACAGGSVPGQVRFPTIAAPGGANPPVTLTATVYRPSGQGPFPAMVVLHHCGGIDGFLHTRARWLTSLGYVTIVPDSFGPRGVSSVCVSGQVSGVQRVPDAYAAADYLRTLPEVRGDRIGVIGFSHGGWTVTEIAQRPPIGTPFRAAVGYYPSCRRGATPPTVPLLILAGELDDWTLPAPCQEWTARTADPARLDMVLYPGAYHAFDQHVDAQARGGNGIMHRVKFDQAAAAGADAKTEAFLARWLKQ